MKHIKLLESFYEDNDRDTGISIIENLELNFGDWAFYFGGSALINGYGNDIDILTVSTVQNPCSIDIVLEHMKNEFNVNNVKKLDPPFGSAYYLSNDEITIHLQIRK